MTTTNPFAPSPVPSSSFFDAISGSSLCRSLSRGADLIHSIRCSPLSRTSSRTASCGKAKRSPAISTIRAAANLLDIAAYDIHADAAAGNAGDFQCGRKTRSENQIIDLRLRRDFGFADEAGLKRLGLDAR